MREQTPSTPSLEKPPSPERLYLRAFPTKLARIAEDTQLELHKRGCANLADLVAKVREGVLPDTDLDEFQKRLERYWSVREHRNNIMEWDIKGCKLALRLMGCVFQQSKEFVGILSEDAEDLGKTISSAEKEIRKIETELASLPASEEWNREFILKEKNQLATALEAAKYVQQGQPIPDHFAAQIQSNPEDPEFIFAIGYAGFAEHPAEYLKTYRQSALQKCRNAIQKLRTRRENQLQNTQTLAEKREDMRFFGRIDRELNNAKVRIGEHESASEENLFDYAFQFIKHMDHHDVKTPIISAFILALPQEFWQWIADHPDRLADLQVSTELEAIWQGQWSGFLTFGIPLRTFDAGIAKLGNVSPEAYEKALRNRRIAVGEEDVPVDQSAELALLDLAWRTACAAIV